MLTEARQFGLFYGHELAQAHLTVRQAIEAFGGVYPIQPGMTLKANVILEKQSFLGWLLEPINAVRHRT